MSRFGKAWVRFPETVARGQTLEVRAMIIHPHESGFRLDNVGRPIPRNIVTTFTCTYGGRQVFRAHLHPAMSSNPYFVFSVIAQESGDLVFEWTDDRGDVASHTAPLTVTA